MVAGRHCSAFDPADCWCSECLLITRWDGTADERFLWKGPKSFVRSESRQGTDDTEATRIIESAVQPWRLRAVERALFLHGILNQRLGICYLNFGDAIVAATCCSTSGCRGGPTLHGTKEWEDEAFCRTRSSDVGGIDHGAA
jgi:hypothetical protein